MAESPDDCLQRLLFESIHARAVRVSLREVLAEVRARQHYPAAVEQLLGEALLVAAMLSSGIKFTGRISLQLQSSGPVKFLLADCTDSGGLRAIARLREGVSIDQDVAELWRSVQRGGVLTLTLEPAGKGERWQGIVPIEGDGLSEAIEAYFERSEQLATRVRLAVDSERASALMIQRMPGEGEEVIDDDGWNRLEHLLATVGERELLRSDGAELFERLFHGETRRAFPARELQFHCPCSRERVAEVLFSLGAAEVRQMIDEGELVEVQCEFCAAAYQFGPEALAALLDEQPDSPDPGDRTLH